MAFFSQLRWSFTCSFFLPQFKYMNFHIFTFILSPQRVYNEFTLWPAPSWLDSSIGRALHRYRRGQGFESRSSQNFFRLSFRSCFSCLYNCDIDSFFRSSNTWIFICSLSLFVLRDSRGLCRFFFYFFLFRCCQQNFRLYLTVHLKVSMTYPGYFNWEISYPTASVSFGSYSATGSTGFIDFLRQRFFKIHSFYFLITSNKTRLFTRLWEWLKTGWNNFSGKL